MRKKEVDRKFDEIVEFSGVEKFLDTPVKRYSSGMRVRLAFAVAAHLEPEILIIDEVLAVGDAAFQEKCLSKMQGCWCRRQNRIFCIPQHASSDSIVRPRHPVKGWSSICRRPSSGKWSQITCTKAPRRLPNGAGPTLKPHQERRLSGCDRYALKNEQSETSPSIDIRTSVGFEMTFDVIKDGYTLMPHFKLLNDEGVCAFVTLDVDPEWRKKKTTDRHLYGNCLGTWQLTQ